MKSNNVPDVRPTWSSRFKAAYHKLLKMRGEPREIAAGMALGIMVGMSPFMGFQTVIALFLSVFFKCSKITAALGVQITNVFTAPIIYPIVYKVGHAVCGVSSLPKPETYLSFHGIMEVIKHSPLILVDLIIGGIILGIPLSIVAYWLTLKTVENYRSKIKPKLTSRRSKRSKKGKRRKR